jgi:tRNA threonylcarbamoyl adenosine modification protein YeaZ
MLLALDTATPATTVALCDDDRVIGSVAHVDALHHGELLAPAIQQVLADTWVAPTQLTAIAVGVGPGPFTGLRVGLVTARMLGAVLQIPVSGVCSLDILALSGPRGEIVVATDARRKEVFWARYLDHRRVDGPHVDRPADVRSDLPTLGEAAQIYPEQFPRAAEPVYPTAERLGVGVARGEFDLLPAVPLYLRRPDAVIPGVRKPVS